MTSGEDIRFHPLRIPSIWALRHDGLIDATREHCWGKGGGLLLSVHGDKWDFLGSSGRAAGLAARERMFAKRPACSAPRCRCADYSCEVEMLLKLCTAMLKLQSEDPAFDASCPIDDRCLEDKLRARTRRSTRSLAGIPLSGGATNE